MPCPMPSGALCMTCWHDEALTLRQQRLTSAIGDTYDMDSHFAESTTK